MSVALQVQTSSPKDGRMPAWTTEAADNAIRSKRRLPNALIQLLPDVLQPRSRGFPAGFLDQRFSAGLMRATKTTNHHHYASALQRACPWCFSALTSSTPFSSAAFTRL